MQLPIEGGFSAEQAVKLGVAAAGDVSAAVGHHVDNLVEVDVPERVDDAVEAAGLVHDGFEMVIGQELVCMGVDADKRLEAHLLEGVGVLVGGGGGINPGAVTLERVDGEERRVRPGGGHEHGIAGGEAQLANHAVAGLRADGEGSSDLVGHGSGD